MQEAAPSPSLEPSPELSALNDIDLAEKPKCRPSSAIYELNQPLKYEYIDEYIQQEPLLASSSTAPSIETNVIPVASPDTTDFVVIPRWPAPRRVLYFNIQKKSTPESQNYLCYGCGVDMRSGLLLFVA